MLHVQRGSRNRYSLPLHESMQFVVISFCFVWCIVDDALFTLGDFSKAGTIRLLGKKKKGLKGCSVMCVLNHMEGVK